jgi:hypothetical protein
VGYTHYFDQNRHFTMDEWNKVCQAAIRIIQHCQGTGIELLYDDRYNEPPLVDDEVIRFNGSDLNGEDLGHETFLLDRYGSGYQFCKTARKPYDRAVSMILLAVMDHAPDVYNIRSDGGWDEDTSHESYDGGWVVSRKFYRAIFGRDVECPESF